ncbi:31888_t:CDS:2, partial [Racocetra persica]
IIRDIFVILLDATHRTNKHKDLLYTLLSPDPKTGKGIMLAHLISSRKNFKSVQYWFYNLRAQFPNWQGPTAFLVDCDLAQIKALHVVFPERHKLTSDEKRSLESELFEDLKYLMNIDNINVIDEWLNEPDEYGNLNEIDKIMWIKAYRTRIPRTNMDTTNMLESWHK